ncbi:DUF4893 domain-containing protein [Sphingomonas sp. 28-62-11]|uniref:DUF4893 domain-containing protein n=1 Tax=Sphingomonas sp. 28-62-11 TaxID=1970432 RepID=UPI000BC75A28|nr:MAG: hypothetical protein B7Y49_04105 [Sphingomonas sp. 28-62-11]
MSHAAATPGRHKALRRAALVIGLALPLAGCGGRDAVTAPNTPSAVSEVLNWRMVATKVDRERLRNWRDAWTTGVDQARRQNAAQLAAQGALFDADRALPGALPPPGTYRCRVFKLGAKGVAMADFTRYGDFDCQVDRQAGVSRFYKNSGAQRAMGTIYDDSTSRGIFLGTLQLGDESRPMEYGRDGGRDLAGFVDRVGDKRWRIVLPYPQFESIIDVIELVPAG